MNPVPVSDEVRPWQAQMRRVIYATYPNGVPAVEYEPLIYVLADKMSFRSVAALFSDCGIADYAKVYLDVMGIVDQHEKYGATGKPILAKLIAHGYDPDAD